MENSNPFKKASRVNSKLRLGLAGPAGSGKTMSALRIARGLAEVTGDKIAVVDTEKGSAALYCDVVDFDVLPFGPPYKPDRYINAIRLAENFGYGIIILDSISHEWFGEGGVLETVDRLKGNTKNDFAAWRTVTPKHNEFIEAMLQSSAHVIATMRSKTAYDLVKDERTGKTRPVKVGQAPVQRDGMDYEFTTILDIEVETHTATSSKDRTKVFDQSEPHVLTEADGQRLAQWLFVDQKGIGAADCPRFNEEPNPKG
jgi:hypothetical protein